MRINSNYLILFFSDNQLSLILKKTVIKIKIGIEIEPAIGIRIEPGIGIVILVIGTVVPEIGKANYYIKFSQLQGVYNQKEMISII